MDIVDPQIMYMVLRKKTYNPSQLVDRESAVDNLELAELECASIKRVPKAPYMLRRELIEIKPREDKHGQIFEPWEHGCDIVFERIFE